MSDHEIRLLVTDLDGTLVGSASDFPLFSVFQEKIGLLAAKHRTVWAICSGRSLRNFLSFLDPMRSMGIEPQFAVVKHAYIYELTHFGYVPHIIWNTRTRLKIWREKHRASQLLHQCRDTIRKIALDSRVIRRSNHRLLMRFSSDESATVAAGVISDLIRESEQLRVFRYHNELDIVSVPFTKGLAVAELARHLGIERNAVLTIGNGHNDISMLDGRVAGMVGCPINSEQEVMEAVNKARGHISKYAALAGMLDVLDSYIKDTVNSKLPNPWPPEGNDRRPFGTSFRPSRSPAGFIVRFALILLATYVVVTALASVDLLPFSHQITAPARVALTRLEKLLALLF